VASAGSLNTNSLQDETRNNLNQDEAATLPSQLSVTANDAAAGGDGSQSSRVKLVKQQSVTQ